MFASATRQYSRRQQKWYRQDQRFLFVCIRRQQQQRRRAGHQSPRSSPKSSPKSSPSSSGAGAASSPYEAVRDEVLHWARAPRDEYSGCLQRQIELGASYSKLLSHKKHIPSWYTIEDETTREVMCRLVASGALTLPKYHDDPNKVAAWAASLCDRSQGVTPDDFLDARSDHWTATGGAALRRHVMACRLFIHLSLPVVLSRCCLFVCRVRHSRDGAEPDRRQHARVPQLSAQHQ